MFCSVANTPGQLQTLIDNDSVEKPMEHETQYIIHKYIILSITDSHTDSCYLISPILYMLTKA